MAKTTAEKFWAKVDYGGPMRSPYLGPCWVWTGSRRGGGYGEFAGKGAHRIAYEMFMGPVPQGLVMDHLCRVRQCVNPAHLEPVTPRENNLRGNCGKVRAAQLRALTHCRQGHPFDEANTYIMPNGWRRCRACWREGKQRKRDELVAQRTAA